MGTEFNMEDFTTNEAVANDILKFERQFFYEEFELMQINLEDQANAFNEYRAVTKKGFVEMMNYSEELRDKITDAVARKLKHYEI